MKRISIIIAMAGVLLVSCKPNIEQYMAEIEDAVRFQLAVAASPSTCEELDDIWDIYQWMGEIKEATRMRTVLCRDILAERAETDIVSARVLKLYDNQEIKLSKLQPTQDKNIWTFYELNSNIHFSFELIPTQDGEMYYSCTADEDDLQAWMLKMMTDMLWDVLEL